MLTIHTLSKWQKQWRYKCPLFKVQWFVRRYKSTETLRYKEQREVSYCLRLITTHYKLMTKSPMQLVGHFTGKENKPKTVPATPPPRPKLCRRHFHPRWHLGSGTDHAAPRCLLTPISWAGRKVEALPSQRCRLTLPPRIIVSVAPR